MNKDDLIKKLENLDLPEVELPSHERRLKMALLNSGYFKEKTTMFTLKKFMPASAVALVAVIAVIGVVSLTGSPSPVSAQEIAQKSYQTVSNLSADQQEALKHTVGFDSRTALQEAYNAKDLQALTYDEFAGSGPVPPDPDGKLHTLKFLRYTNADGQIVTLGIDQNSNLPTFGSVRGAEVNPAGGENSFNTQFRGDKGDGQGLVNCTTENGVEKCEKVSE